MDIKVFSPKKCISVAVAILIALLSIFTFSTDSNAESNSSRAYWRHDYSSSNMSSYTRYTLSLSSSSNSARNVFGSNDMVRDYDTSVVRLSVGGTGFIIGEHTIVTAGHCVYNQTNDTFINFSISIIDSNNNVIETISPKYVHVTENFAQANSYQVEYDYALIYVEEDLSEYGAFSLGIPLDSYISNNGSVIASGFPQAYPDGYVGADWGIRFKASGNVLSGSTSLVLYFDADTGNGDSGGPVYVEEGVTYGTTLEEYKTVIAIDVAQNNYSNCGVRITTELLYFYYSNPYKTA